MANYIKEYSAFYEFIDRFMPNGFKEVNESDSIFLELNELLDTNNQFFFYRGYYPFENSLDK